MSFSQSFKYDVYNEHGEKIRDISEDEWKKEVIERVFSVESECTWLIFHDKDTKKVIDSDTNEVIEEEVVIHYHGIFIFKNGRYMSSIAELIETEQIEQLRDYEGHLRYLTHTTESAMADKKYRYEIDELYCKENNEILNKEQVRKLYTEKISGFKNKKDEVNNYRDIIVSEILNGKLALENVKDMYLKKFGAVKGDKYYIDSLSRFEKSELDYIDKRNKKLLRKGRRLITVYIYGESGAGKTTIANVLCRKQSKRHMNNEDDVFFAGSEISKITVDYFQNYQGEYSTLFDEFMPEKVFTFSAFNNIFNPTKGSLVSSRNKNKAWVSEFAVISKANHIDNLVNTMCLKAEKSESNDFEKLKKQIQRRIPIVIEVKDREIIVNIYDEKNNNYIEYKKYKNLSVKDDDSTKIDKFTEEIDELIEEKRNKIFDMKKFKI